MKNYLNFEAEVKELETQLDNLKDPYNNEGISEVNTNEIISLEEKINHKLEKIYSNLNPWETTQVARHEDRPKSKFFIENLFDDFVRTHYWQILRCLFFVFSDSPFYLMFG